MMGVQFSYDKYDFLNQHIPGAGFNLGEDDQDFISIMNQDQVKDLPANLRRKLHQQKEEYQKEREKTITQK